MTVATGASFSFGELVAELRGTELELRWFAQPTGTYQCLQLLNRALVGDCELTLIDPLLHLSEVEALGLDGARRDAIYRSPGRPNLTVSDLAHLAGGQSQMRLGLYTSGSTGIPSRVVHRLESLARGVRKGPRHADDVWALTYRPTHIAAVQVWLQALANGNTLVDVNGLPPQKALDAMATHGVTHISATPSYYRALLGLGRALPTIKSVTLGGELVTVELLAQVRALFPGARLHNVYASTEAGPLLESSGELFRIPDAKREVIEVRDGRLHVHRSLLGAFKGGNAVGPDDWYDTGDVVEEAADPCGWFRFVARSRDWANVGGFKVNPHEVEATMRRHPEVREVRVVPQGNSVMGQILVAEVALKPKADARAQMADVTIAERELRAWLAERLHPAKVPRMIRFVTQLAQTYSGKVSRK